MPASKLVRAEHHWQRARQVSDRALRAGALVPLATRTEPPRGWQPFVVRRLLSRPPLHLSQAGPRRNPFLPWDRPLEVDRLGEQHVLLLNKYPVQECHLLLISREWRPQRGWLEDADWQAVGMLAADTGGLWFFNSDARAGASQPHRHLQLLPRRTGEPSCPLETLLQHQLREGTRPWPWAYRLSPRQDPGGGADLPRLYADHCAALGLGTAADDPQPRHSYNLLFDDHWFLTVRRSRESCAGFSVNGLGFAGYLLRTDRCDLDWLVRQGPWALLAEVAASPGGA